VTDRWKLRHEIKHLKPNGQNMVTNFHMWSRMCFSVISTSLVVACQGIVTFPDGHPSAMNAENNRLRTQLLITAGPLPTSAIYRPINCAYRLTRTPYKKPTTHSRIDVSIRPVAGRLLVASTVDGKVSTALIGTNGKLYDFNSVDLASNERDTPETFRQSAERTISQSDKQSAHVINEFSALMPEYIRAPRNVGDTVAVVFSEDNAVWASYQYRGITSYNGEVGEVLDLTRVMANNSQYGAAIVGFDIVDVKTTMPMLSVIDAGTKVRLERITCLP
jgi:hypothetical protein